MLEQAERTGPVFIWGEYLRHRLAFLLQEEEKGGTDVLAERCRSGRCFLLLLCFSATTASSSGVTKMRVMSLARVIATCSAFSSSVPTSLRRESATAGRMYAMRSSTSTILGNSSDSNGSASSIGTGAPTKPYKVDLLSLSKQDLETLVTGWGFPKYRAGQIESGLAMGKGFEDLNIPNALRGVLHESASVGSMSKKVEQISKDGTIKRAYELHDGRLIESVLMPYKDGRRTACISSQAGCAMGCTFCATGQGGFARQLSSAEIFEQAYHFSTLLRSRGERLSNVVVMGMGEGFLNYNALIEAIKRIQEELGIGARHVTVSTVGIAPRIRKFAREGMQVKLAVSLHAATDRERSSIMPVNNRYPLSELIDACVEYADITNRRVTFEWALISGTNDSQRVAEGLAALLRPLKGKCHVNLIPLNPTKEFSGGPSNAVRVKEFIAVLERAGVPATARVRRGIDIDAGCGQLTAKVQAPSAGAAGTLEDDELTMEEDEGGVEPNYLTS